MKKKKANELLTAQTNKVLGVQANNIVQTSILPSIILPAVAERTWKKVIDITGSSWYIFMLSGALFGNAMLTVDIINIRMLDTILINKSRLSTYGGGSQINIKYKIEGNNIRVWVDSSYMFGTSSLVCLTGNYQPIAIVDTPPADAITL